MVRECGQLYRDTKKLAVESEIRRESEGVERRAAENREGMEKEREGSPWEARKKILLITQIV